MKKFLKIIGVVLLLVIGLLIAAPFILEAKIGDLIKNNANNNMNAHLDFAEADLSLIQNFPSASLRLQKVTLLNKAPFEGDTLFAANDVYLTLGVSQLFNSENDPIAIDKLSIDGALINVKVNEAEEANYDIGKESVETATTTADDSDGFTLDLQSYELLNSKIVYDDQAGKMYFELDEIQHTGKGDLSANRSELDSHTEATISFAMDSTTYFSKNKIKLDALIDLDLENSKYTFLKNEAVLNQLPLVFDGFIQLHENSQEVAITFKTPSSDFKNFLAVIPEAYSKDIADVKTTGDFVLEGNFNGVVDETHIPKFDIKINSNNASFKYADLPKAVKNVFIDVDIVNTTGITEDTYVNIDKLSFMIDQDKFNMVAKIKELMGNTKVNAHLDGKMNLANIQKAYPMSDGLDLKGILEADITTAFDMASIEKEQYEKTTTKGTMSLQDFEYTSEEIPNPVKLKSTAVTFNPKTVTLSKLVGTTGKTDFSATGTINNFLGYMFNDENVEGNFDLKSDTFALDDFMVAEETTGSTNGGGETAPAEEKIKIPSFLDANITATANTVLYDDLVLKDVKGNLKIKDEKAILSNMTTSIFDGKMAFDGEVSTKNDTPTFAMKLGMSQLEIGETFKSLELLKALAPIANILTGKLDSDIVLSGALTDDFTPNLATLSGDMLANIFTKDVDTESAPMLSALASKLDFIDLKKLNLNDLKTKLSFENGVVTVKPFTVNYQDIDVQIEGSHSFDQKMNYKASMEVPAKYLGSEITSLIAKIDDKELENLTIPVIANIGGDYTSPKVTTDITSGVKTLTSRLIEVQKQKLINTGKDKAKDLLSGVLGTSTSASTTDETSSTTTKETAKDAVKDVLGGVLGNNKTETTEEDKKDSVPVKKEEAVKEKAKDILGGLLGKKKSGSN